MNHKADLENLSARIRARKPLFSMGQIVRATSQPFGEASFHGIVTDIGIELSVHGTIADYNYLVAFPDFDDVDQCLYWSDELLPEIDLEAVEVAA